ncbi:hypothetical protein L1987_30287 [Smallanthus sonchifolius]|uniref:Uncharacterized protein n=1 Tax=Smallanthus sonchifolius TaxID=185202 RepID=A0ACB9I2E4_9ASTR|nr:hypothetical protein L1987_30287 [Smallanthus sonchifolius]
MVSVFQEATTRVPPGSLGSEDNENGAKGGGRQRPAVGYGERLCVSIYRTESTKFEDMTSRAPSCRFVIGALERYRRTQIGLFLTRHQNKSKVHDYMNSQPEINDKMRAILINLLIEVH